MKIPSWTYYGLGAAGGGFAWHAETPGWGAGVASPKTSALVWLSVPKPVPKGCSRSTRAAGRLSGLRGHGLLSGMLKQGCGEGWGTAGDVVLRFGPFTVRFYRPAGRVD